MYETGAPPDPHPPDGPEAVLLVPVPHDVLAPAPSRAAGRVRPVREYDSPSAVLPGLPLGTVSYRLRGTETGQDG
jgi:hypothetical protein